MTRDEGERRVLACARCGRVLSGHRGDYRSGLLMDESPMTVLPLTPDPAFFVDDRIVFRRWCCPGCLTLLTTQVARSGDPSVPELLFA